MKQVHFTLKRHTRGRQTQTGSNARHTDAYTELEKQKKRQTVRNNRQKEAIINTFTDTHTHVHTNN